MRKRIFIGAIVILALIVVVNLNIWAPKEQINTHPVLTQQVQQTEMNMDGNNQKNIQLDEEGFLWYKVPELGIMFKVTDDTLNDLTYEIKNYQTKDFEMDVKSGTFYSRSEAKGTLDDCGYSSSGGSNCGCFFINVISKSKSDEYKETYNQDWCQSGNGKTILQDQEKVVCLYSSEDNLSLDSEYKNHFHMDSNEIKETYGIFFDSVQSVPKYNENSGNVSRNINSQNTIDTSNWKKYRDDELGIEFLYPPGSLIEKVPSGAMEETWLMSITPARELSKREANQYHAYFNIAKFDSFLDPKTWAAQKLGKKIWANEKESYLKNGDNVYYSKEADSIVDHNYVISYKKAIYYASFREIDCCIKENLTELGDSTGIFEPEPGTVHTEYLPTFEALVKSIKIL